MRFILAMSVLCLIFPRTCLAKGCEQNEKEVKLFKAYIAVRANSSDNNLDKFCTSLDEWGYPNYFNFVLKDLKNKGGVIIETLIKYARRGKPRAIESLLKSEIIVFRDNNTEYSEWLGEEVFFIASKDLEGLFKALKKQDEPIRNYTLDLLKSPISDNLNKELITKQLKEERIRSRYPEFVRYLE